MLKYRFSTYINKKVEPVKEKFCKNSIHANLIAVRDEESLFINYIKLFTYVGSTA